MILDFQRGSPERPRGHALAFFESADGRVYATYLVVTPITIDLARYMPPMFAGQLPPLEAQQSTAMPLPPVPEQHPEGIVGLEWLAALRDDDLINCGRIDPGQVDRMLMATAEAGQTYAGLYRDHLARSPAASLREQQSFAVEDVLASLMSESDRIAEMARAIGRARFGIELRDEQVLEEAISEMERVGRSLPEKYRVAELISAARRPDSLGARLAQLHVERCLKLAAEEYVEVGRIEGEIRRLAS